MKDRIIKEGDWVLLTPREGKNFLVQITSRVFHTHRDSFDLSFLIDRPWGSAIQGKKGEVYYALRPSLYDHLMKIKRLTQIIYPKDIGYILLKLDVSPGKVLLECGTGSGSLLMALAQAVGETGKIITYEKEDRFRKVALENIKRLALERRVIFKGLAIEAFDEEEEVDGAFLDIKTPWELLSAAWRALKAGAPLGILLPTTNQVTQTLKALEDLYKEGFSFVGTEILEILLRRYKNNPERFRPEDRMVAHTGYLLFTRKALS